MRDLQSKFFSVKNYTNVSCCVEYICTQVKPKRRLLSLLRVPVLNLQKWSCVRKTLTSPFLCFPVYIVLVSFQLPWLC